MNGRMRGWAGAGAIMVLAGVMMLMSGCVGLWVGEPAVKADGGYVPVLGDWCQYNLHGNLQMKLFVLEVERASVFLVREFSAGGQLLRSEQVEVPRAQLRGYVSEPYRNAEWTVVGTDVLDLRGRAYEAEVRETASDKGTLRAWMVAEIPVTGVALLRDTVEGGQSIDTMRAVNWGRLNVKEEEANQ